MKGRTIGILALLAVSLHAIGAAQPCDLFSIAYGENLPEHYCECEYSANSFAFPVDTVLSEPAWFTATLDDLKQGLSAYWFSDDSVVMDVYAFCFSAVPSFSMTVAPNRMYEMDVELISKKLDELGSASSFLTALTPHIHIYTVHGGAGQVYCYPYNQGPHSTCDEALEIYPWMTYVCSEPENVYRMPYSRISSQGHAFIQWKHKPAKATQPTEPAAIRLTRGTCDGETVGSAILTDSLHVYQPDSALLVEMRAAQEDLWVHVKHEKGVTGRLRYFNNPKYVAPLAAYTNSTCVGKTLTVNQRTYDADTAFVDTFWVGGDTLRTQEVNLSFALNAVYDTVLVKESELRRGYVHSSGVVLRAYGDTVVDIVKDNTCTKRYYITVQSPTGTETVNGGQNARKQLINGQIVILVDDRQYNVLGQQINQNK